MVVVSISGIRGVVNDDLPIEGLLIPLERFSEQNPSKEFLVARDTRSTGQMIYRAVIGMLLERGLEVVDYGVVSTPALFRESRVRSAPAAMITASHNEPDWNGVKFILNGRGITQVGLDKVIGVRSRRGIPPLKAGGSLKTRVPSYNSDLLEKGGKDSCEGMRVVIDLNGGAAINHAPIILSGIGCDLNIIGGTPGLFDRTIDPTADGLELLCKTVKDVEADVGFAFDCDGDRLVLVDDDGEKRTGDFMLALAMKKTLLTHQDRKVVVSVDTTRAVEDVVKAMGGEVYRSRVGEANVVSKMVETGATVGGEGSSGGLIDGSYNYCRDSMLAAIAIVQALSAGGSKVFREVPSYTQVRLKTPMDRRKASEAIRRLQKDNPESDLTDGVKLEPSRGSWVLIRVSGTEDAVRVSAESNSEAAARELAEAYLKRVKSLG